MNTYNNASGAPQPPAEGILKQNDFGNSKWYKIACSCSAHEHEVDMAVESEDTGIAVYFFTDTKTAWWKDHCIRNFDWLPYDVKYWINRIINSVSLIYHGIFHGYIKFSADMYLSKQAAVNLANVLVTAIDDVEEFEADRKSKWEAREETEGKEANEINN